MRLSPIFAAVACVAMSAASAAGDAATVRTRGKIDVSANTSIVAVSTDPDVQRVLNDDFYAARRGPRADTKVTATLTVTLTQRVLKPGVSLSEIAPGDPGVVALLRAAGATPPPIGDSGVEQPDPYENVAKMQALRPDNPSIQQLKQEQAYNRSLGMPGTNPFRTHDDEQTYDTVIVARVTVDDRRDQFMVVALAHPGDDARQVKKLVAEEIANAALH